MTRFAITDRGGLQPERTTLSWQRTAVSANIGVVAVLLVDVRGHHWALALLSAVAALATTGFVNLLRRRVGHLSGGYGAEAGAASPWPDMLRVGAVVVTLAALGIATAVAVLLGG
ncbi:MAG TPA: DUF202 domain-containing protein [Segeticoccus sp.]|nr:DUF202 domain-containing protein [Segeticoccus sp.]